MLFFVDQKVVWYIACAQAYNHLISPLYTKSIMVLFLRHVGNSCNKIAISRFNGTDAGFVIWLCKYFKLTTIIDVYLFIMILEVGVAQESRKHYVHRHICVKLINKNNPFVSILLAWKQGFLPIHILHRIKIHDVQALKSINHN